MIARLSVLAVGLDQRLNIQLLDHSINHTHRMILGNHFFYGGWKKPVLLLVIGFELMTHISDYQYLKVRNLFQNNNNSTP